MHPKTRSHNLYLPATESHETTQKLSFGPKEVDSACSMQKNKSKLRKHQVVHFMHHKTQSHNGYLPATESRETTQKLSFGPKEVDSACSLRKNKTQLRMHKVVHFMHPKTRSHNGHLPAMESRETTHKLSFGPKEVDSACSLRKNKTQLRMHKVVVHFMHPKTRSHNGTSRKRNRAKPPRNLVLGLKKWIGHVRCKKTRRNFGSTKWCILCTPKPDITTCTSRQRNRAKPPRNIVLGLKKWIGHVRCEKTRRNFGSTKWCIVCNPKPDL